MQLHTTLFARARMPSSLLGLPGATELRLAEDSIFLTIALVLQEAAAPLAILSFPAARAAYGARCAAFGHSLADPPIQRGPQQDTAQ